MEVMRSGRSQLIPFKGTHVAFLSLAAEGGWHALFNLLSGAIHIKCTITLCATKKEEMLPINLQCDSFASLKRVPLDLSYIMLVRTTVTMYKQ